MGAESWSPPARPWNSLQSRVETNALFDAALAFLDEPYVTIEPVDKPQVVVAAQAYRRYGKGHHRAALNLGDVFAYALARVRNIPLLFKGNDFSQTGIDQAVR